MRQRHDLRYVLATLVLSLALAGEARASQIIPIWPGAAPGTEAWTQKELTIPKTPVGTVVLNVVTPTLTAFLPTAATSKHIGVIVAPGGYCVALAIGQTYDVAKWLQAHGIAAFVLKYRIPEKKQQGIPDVDMDVACKYGTADAIEAVNLVRRRAPEWGIAADRIGVMGLSAGGMVVDGAVLQPDVAARPDFAAFIYGGPFGVMPVVPAKLPPIFMAWAQDDPIARIPVVKFYDALVSAGDAPEAHIYASGGHGFAIKPQGTTSDYWIDEFFDWLTTGNGMRRTPRG
jgi:acetyl esterase/lipase